MKRIYPESKVEIQGFTARNYDRLLQTISLGRYGRFIREAVAALELKEGDFLLDLGCGTGSNACLMRPYVGDPGEILGVDLSPEMRDQFRENCAAWKNVKFLHARIDLPLQLQHTYDHVFMSFVLHGFPQEVRLRILENVVRALRPGGRFQLLDFSEFSLKAMPWYFRIPFKTLECPYAFDFIARDWREILGSLGFGDFREQQWFRGYVRLLTAVKGGETADQTAAAPDQDNQEDSGR